MNLRSTRSAGVWASSSGLVVRFDLPLTACAVLGADQQRPPRRAREDAADSGQDQAISRLKARPVNLAFEDTQPVTKGENLDLERGVRLPSEDADIEQRPDRQQSRARSVERDHDGPAGGMRATLGALRAVLSSRSGIGDHLS